MSRIERFEDIEAWKKARELTKEIYALTNEGPLPETSACAIRSEGRRSLFCQTSLKALSVV